MEAEVRLRHDVAVLSIAKPTFEKMTSRRYSVTFGCHARLDPSDSIRNGGRFDGRPGLGVLARSMSSIVEPDGELPVVVDWCSVSHVMV